MTNAGVRESENTNVEWKKISFKDMRTYVGFKAYFLYSENI